MMKGWIKPLSDYSEKHPQLQSGDLQWQIAKHIVGEAQTFEFLSEGEQGEILYDLQTKGITKVINEATNQTDLMEEAQKNEIQEHKEQSLHPSADNVTGVVGDISRRERALLLDARIKDAMTDIYIATAEIIDNKLYQELGHDTARSYFDTIAISERKAYQYAVIGREIKPHAYLSDGSLHSGAESASKLGVKKLEEIVRHAKDQIDNLISNGEIEIGGSTLSREELESTSVRDLRKQLKEAKEAKQENEHLKHQLEHANRSVEDLRKDIVDLSPYRQNLYRVRDVREQLSIFSDLIGDASRVLNGINTEKIDEDTQAEVVKTVNVGFDLIERFMQANAAMFTKHAE